MIHSIWAGAGKVLIPVLWVGGFVLLMRLIALLVKMKRG